MLDWKILWDYSILDLLQLRYGDDDGDNLVGVYVVAHLKRDSVQPGEKVRRLLFSKCICFYWFLVFLKFWIFGILNTYFSTTISVISDLVLLWQLNEWDNHKNYIEANLWHCDIMFRQQLCSYCTILRRYAPPWFLFLEYFPESLSIWQSRYTHSHIMNKFHTMSSHPMMIFHPMIIFHPMGVLDILHMMDAHQNDLQPLMVDIHSQTWDLSKNLHDWIFGPRILHT